MKLGIACIAFNRPGYLKECVNSLKGQTEKAEYHLFQDGSVNKFSGKVRGEQKLIDESIATFGDLGQVHYSKENIGNALNQFRAVEFMSSHYDYFVVIEEDVVLSKYYLRLIKLLIRDYLERPDVFSVALNFKRMCNKKAIEDNLNKAGFNLAFPGSKSLHWWAECFSSERWQEARPYFLEYLEFVRECDYRDRPSQEIVKFFYSKGFDVPHSSQDAAKDYVVYRCGMKRVNSIVNRGYSIGRKGMHFSPVLFKQKGFENQKPYEFESDKTLKRFVL